MAQIYNATNKTKSDVIEVSKGFAHLAIGTDGALTDITTETITLYVERKGDTADIAREMLLIDFIALGTEGQDAIVSMGTLKCVACCDLTVNGGNVKLGENEKIKVQLTNLKTAKTYQMNTIESSFEDSELQDYTRKTMASETLNQDFDVRGHDLLSLQKDDSITEINFTYDNGHVAKMDAFEAELFHKTLDPVVAINEAGVVQSGFPTRLVFLLTGITNVNIRKSAGVLLNFSTRINADDALLYNVKR
ncbi:hypothetical protein [Flavobacterium undicola]|uniref:hypothetical protein n=1 Tax=Flavobacterium undicola TaxID=1932779 RepID=UPI001378536B|nr:hypothetical protein [Flavobacterium undicola]MBA0883799.1 hypothetical protein [Flavobacterium undicola]